MHTVIVLRQFFISMINTGKPLGLKSRPFSFENGVTCVDTDYSIWARGWDKNIEERPDYLGNYLFGYYGQGYMVLSGESLKMGAGVAQTFSDIGKGNWSKALWMHIILTWSVANHDPEAGFEAWKEGGYGDNPDDGNMIQEGIDAYEKYKQSK